MGSFTLQTWMNNMSKSITVFVFLLQFNFQSSNLLHAFPTLPLSSPHRHQHCNYYEQQQKHEQLHPITASTAIISTAAEIVSTSTSLNLASKITHSIESIHPNQPPHRPKRVPFLPNTNNPYIIFKLDQNASKEEIKKAYNKYMKKFHPDSRLTPYSTQEERMRAHDDFNRINAAYAILTSKPQYEPHGGAPTGPMASTTHTGRGYGGTSDDSGGSLINGDAIKRDTGMAKTNMDHLYHGYGVPVARGIIPPLQRQGLGGTSDDRAIEKGRAPPSLARVMELKRKSDEARLRAHEARMVEEMKAGKGYGGTSNDVDGRATAQTNSDHLRGYRRKNAVKGIVPPLQRKGLGGTSDDGAIERGQVPPSMARVMEQKKRVDEARLRAHEMRLIEEMKAGKGYGGTSNDVDGRATAQTNSDHLRGYRRKNVVRGIVPPLQRKGLGGTSDDGAIEQGRAPPSLERAIEQRKKAQEARRTAREAGIVEERKVAAIIPPLQRKGLGGTSDDSAIEKGHVPPSLAQVIQHKEKIEEAKRKAFEERMIEEKKVAEETKKMEEASLDKDQEIKEEEARNVEKPINEMGAQKVNFPNDQTLKKARLAEDEKMKEEARIADSERMVREARIAEERRDRIEAEKARIAEEQRIKQKARLAEDQKRKEKVRAAVEKRFEKKQDSVAADWNRMVQEARMAEERRIKEETRLAEDQSMKEEALFKEERKLVEQERVADLKQLAQEARDAEEVRIEAEAQKARIIESHQRFESEGRRPVKQDDIADLERLTQEALTAEEIIMRAEAQKARIIEEHERFIAESLRLAEQARLAKKKRVVE